MGIINAASVNTKYQAGDYAGVQAASAAAGKWTKIGLGVGVGGYVLYGILMLSGVGAGMISGMRPQ